MAIKNIKFEQAGMAGVKPKFVFIQTDDSIATVTALGYLNDIASKQNLGLSSADKALVITKESATADEVANIFAISKSGDDFLLTIESANIALPTTADHIATYTGADGSLSQNSNPAINAGDIQAGLSGTEADLICYPPTAARGKFHISSGDNVGDHTITLQNGSHAQDTVYYIQDVGSAEGSVLVSALSNTEANANLIFFSKTATFQDVISQNPIFTAAPGARYRVIDLYTSQGGTNFSGGDTGISISDGVNVLSRIPDANAKSLENQRWGDAGLTFPPTLPINTSTDAGEDLIVSQTGGTTSYTAGSVVISGLLVRVA